jgi:hypothetical protein
MHLKTLITGIAAVAAMALPAYAASDWAAVGKALGKTGAVQGARSTGSACRARI